MIYFDHSSATHVNPEIIENTKKRLDLFFGDTQKSHQTAVKTRSIIEESRIKVANNLNVSPRTIFFSNSGTQANNIVINSISKKVGAIITSYFEHKSVLEPIKQKFSELNIPVLYVNTTEDSGIDLKHLKELLKQNPHSFVSLAHVNQFTGRLLPFTRVAELCQKYDSVFHSDMAQSFGKINNDLINLGVDIATGSAHKMGALRGTGIIYAKSEIELHPLEYGQNNEYKIIPGTENILSIMSVADAFEYSKEYIKKNWQYLKDFKQQLKNSLDKNNINYKSYGFSDEHFSPYILNLELPEINNIDVFLVKLDMNNIAVDDSRNSKANMLKNIKLSFNATNKAEEINQFINILKLVS